MPSGIIKLNYKGIEDEFFIKNPQITYYNKVYKSYSNFVKIIDKIEIDNKFYLSSPTNITINIDNINYDLLGSLYLLIELDTTIDFDILELIDKIEFYCSEVLIDTLTPSIIKLYTSLYYTPNKHALHKLLYTNNNRNLYYIPLNFTFLNNHDTYVPLYLLYNENINVKVYFKGYNKKDLYATNLDLLVHYFILEKQDKQIAKVNYWLLETITYMNNIKLNVSLRKDVPNNIDIFLFKKYAKALLFTVNDCRIDDLNLYIDNHKLNYTSEHIKYLNLLHTNNHFNEYKTLDSSLYLYNFSLFNNNKISGYLNLNTINKFKLELNPYKINTTITFNILSNFDSYFFITTNLLTSNTTQSPNIFINTNITYTLYNTNTDIIIVNTDPTIYINNNQEIPTSTYYSGFDYINKTLLITDIDTLTDNTLYYCDKTQKINRGILKVSYDNKAIVGEGSLDIFTLNHELYYIKTGKLNIYTF